MEKYKKNSLFYVVRSVVMNSVVFTIFFKWPLEHLVLLDTCNTYAVEVLEQLRKMVSFK